MDARDGSEWSDAAFAVAERILAGRENGNATEPVPMGRDSHRRCAVHGDDPNLGYCVALRNRWRILNHEPTTNERGIILGFLLVYARVPRSWPIGFAVCVGIVLWFFLGFCVAGIRIT